MLNTLNFTVDNYILKKKINVSLGLSQLQSSILLLNMISLYHIAKCLLSYYIYIYTAISKEIILFVNQARLR